MTGVPKSRTQHDDSAEFEIRRRLVADGKLVPGLRDLLRGCPVIGNDRRKDAVNFATGMLTCLLSVRDPQTLNDAFGKMAASPTRSNFVKAALAFEAAVNGTRGDVLKEGAVRCYFYAALCGCRSSASKVAAAAVEVAYAADIPPNAVPAHIEAAVAWLLVATGQLQAPSTWTEKTAVVFLAAVRDPSGPGRGMAERIARNRLDMRSRPVAPDLLKVAPRRRVIQAEHEAATARPTAARTGGRSAGLTVIATIGDGASADGKRVACEFAAILCKPLPLAPMPNRTAVRCALVQEFPHAVSAIDAVLRAMPDGAHATLPPLALAGPPGCGKTTFALRLAACLGAPVHMFPCAGVSDAMFSGASRRWATGGPSVPLAAIRTHRHAAPAIILDELDKTSTSRFNGALADVLLGMLEPTTSERWCDPYAEAPVNLSKVFWLATVNDPSAMPTALRDRMMVVDFPPARREDLVPLAGQLLRERARLRGLDPRWSPPLTGEELDAVATCWRGGSIRTLGRFVDAVAALREQANVLQ